MGFTGAGAGAGVGAGAGLAQPAKIKLITAATSIKPKNNLFILFLLHLINLHCKPFLGAPNFSATFFS